MLIWSCTKNIFLTSETLMSFFSDCLSDSEEEFLRFGHGEIIGVGVFMSLLFATERGEVVQVHTSFDLIAEAG